MKKKLWLEFKSELGLAILSMLLLVIGVMASLSIPRVIGYTIDHVFISKNAEALHQMVILLLGIVLIRAAAVMLQGYLFDRLSQNMMLKIRVKLFEHLLFLPMQDYQKNSTGRLVTRLTNDVSSLSDLFSSSFVSIIANIATVIGVLTILLTTHFKLSLWVMAVMIPLLISSYVISERLRLTYQDQKSKLSRLNSFLAENIMGMKVIQLFSREKHQIRKLKQINEDYARAQFSSVKLFAYFNPIITWGTGIAVALVLWFGSRYHLQGEILPGVLATYIAYVLMLFQPIREATDKWTVFLAGVVAAERIFEVLEWKAEPDQTLLLPDSAQDPAQNKIKFKGKIEFKNVWFSYDLAGVSQEASEVASQEVTEPRYVLKDFNLTIEPGQSIGIVGHTGAGKSTIIQLLMRFFEPQRGEILIDGQSILSYPLQPYRRAVGVIQQDVFLFAGTIEDNIELWEKHATPVAAHSQIQTSTLNSKSLDERGSNLSMGERQMVAFERTFYHEPSIVILDEATAHIDSDTESRIQDSIQAQMKSEIHQRTFITIAHRLASVQNCDFIIVLHKGVMIEKGRHQELLELKGYYHKLHLVQSQESAI